MNKAGVLAVAAAGLIGVGYAGYQSGEKTRQHEREVAKKAFDALGKISPEDQAIIDAYKAMKARWDEKVKDATGGQMDLRDIELRLMLSNMNTSL